MPNILIALFLILSAGSLEAASNPYAVVTFDQFQPGRCWLWTYSQRDRDSGKWSPYFYEQYRVSEVTGKRVTLEMSSSGEFPFFTEPHHKLTVDFAKCERAAGDARLRNFTVEFFTRSYDGNWKIVSEVHPNLVFTEKFNCSSPSATESVIYRDWTKGDETHRLFQVEHRPQREESWYFLNRSGLSGVAGYKMFVPVDEYKAEFTAHGTACNVK